MMVDQERWETHDEEGNKISPIPICPLLKGEEAVVILIRLGDPFDFLTFHFDSEPHPPLTYLLCPHAKDTGPMSHALHH